MKYGVVAFPSKQLQDLANGYRKRYDPRYSKITPHMTLKEVFEADEREIRQVAEAIRKVARNKKPFELNVSKVSTFAPITNTIYFKVNPNEELSSLHDALNNDDFFGGLPKYSFVPHVTIAQDLTSGEHDDIIGQLKMIGVDHTETIDRFHLLYQLDDGSWTVYETFHLQEDN
ncbi:putative phosphoesterase YjcG [Sporosarcina sp. NCCP-2716]|uniref:YjcG family protein n=1 Tax=Sporosarcina sp. NCCP-2716 TaxID=2943679 RepID=UPI0020413038|nr:YjcG family protein [Sporosarcina sp. NCCP-2716]GKV67595.1 putative phosphoesterase YjcG [Sporosarcina sp. NCCP-2716]